MQTFLLIDHMFNFTDLVFMFCFFVTILFSFLTENFDIDVNSTVILLTMGISIWKTN